MLTNLTKLLVAGSLLAHCVTFECDVFAASGEGPVLFVDDTAAGGNNGSSWCDAFMHLQDALAAAAASGGAITEIRVAQGVYKPDQGASQTPGDPEATFRLINGVAILGGYVGCGAPDPDERDIAGYKTILSGDLAGDDVEVSDPRDLFDEPSRSENALHIVTGSGCSASAVLDGFVVTAGNANALYPDSVGGGMFNSDGSPMVTNCTFIGNSSTAGGGMFNDASSPTLANCMFSGNFAGFGGGAIFDTEQSAPSLINCSLAANAADIVGGIFQIADTSVTLTNCILWHNVDESGTTEYSQIAGGGGAVINHSCIQGWTGDLGGVGNIGDDPLFIDADGFDNIPGTDDDNLRLSGCSVVIDGGDNAPPGGLPETDLEGNPRVVGGTVDMGAYEYHGACETDGDCDDHNECAEETCTESVCECVPLVAGIPCGEQGDSDCTHPDTCNEVGACQDNHEPYGTACPDDGDLCTDDICVRGVCAHPNARNGTPCPDDIFCDGEELCVDGICESGDPPCDAPDIVCDEDADRCACVGDNCWIRYVDANATGPTHDGLSWCTAFQGLEDALEAAASSIGTITEIRVADGVYKPQPPPGYVPEPPEPYAEKQLIYSNTNGSFLFRPGAGVPVADDIRIDPLYAELARLRLWVNGGVPTGGGQFAATVSLWDECPNDGGQDFPGTHWTTTFPDDSGTYVIELVVPPGAEVIVHHRFWLQVEFSTDTAGILAGAPADIGFSEDLIDTPANPCAESFGGWPDFPHASFKVEVFGFPVARELTFKLQNGLALRGGYTGCDAPEPDARDPAIYRTVLSGDMNGDDGPEFTNYDDNFFHVVTGSGTNETAVLDGFTITGGNADGNASDSNGGGMYNDNGSPTLGDCVFVNNRATNDGGGIYNKLNAMPTVTQSTFVGNQATGRGGAISNAYSSHPDIIRCVFADNYAISDGGAIHNLRSWSSVLQSIFVGNVAETNGGAIADDEYGSKLLHCLLVGNRAERGGAFASFDAYNSDLRNCTVSDNAALSQGGAVYILNSASNATVVIGNSVVWGDEPDEVFHEGDWGGIRAAYSDICTGDMSAWPGEGNICADPMFALGSVGAWTGKAFYDMALSQSTFVDGNAAWGNNELVGKFLNPDTSQSLQSLIVANTTTTVTVWGRDFASLGLPGVPYQINHYRLDSTPDSPSPCLDAGDNEAAPEDIADLDDDDGDTTEPVPFDLNGDPRFANDPDAPDTGYGLPPIIDMGAYEGPKPVILLNTPWLSVPEDGQATFTVALSRDPGGPVDVAISRDRGDADLQCQSGCVLHFDSSDFSVPQAVTLAATGDADYLNGEALFSLRDLSVSPPGFGPAGLIVTESDDDPTPLIFYVDKDAPGNGDGTSWCGAFTDLQAALDVAHAAPGVEEIRVAAGTYTPAGRDGSRTATFELVSGLAIRGGYPGCGEPDPEARDFASYETILSGDLNGDDDRTPASDCCVATDMPGCDDAACQAAVCEEDPRCCDAAWSDTCARFALVVCCGTCGNKCDNSYHVVTASGTDETAVLEGFTVTRGHGDGPGRFSGGAGMYNVGGSPKILNCAFSEHSGVGAAGVCNVDGSPLLKDCAFVDNVAVWFGGGLTSSGQRARPELTECQFRSNVAGYGSGIYNNWHSAPVIVSSVFVDNVAAAYGGAMCIFDSTPTITQCIFARNASTYGGGLCVQSWGIPSGAIIRNSMFIGNTSARRGGAIYSESMYHSGSTTLSLTSCLLDANKANESGGAVYSNDSNITLRGSTITGNLAPNGSGLAFDSSGQRYPSAIDAANSILWDGTEEIWNNDGSMITITYSDIQDDQPNDGIVYPGTGNIDAAPEFVDADGPDDIPGTEDDNLRLSFGSPCIDASDNTAVPPDSGDVDGDGDTIEPTPRDLNGNPRFVDDCHTEDTGIADPQNPMLPIVDTGAYEYQPFDTDYDGHVDLKDFAAFQVCYTGSDSGPVETTCERLDANCDDDVNLTDFADLRSALARP